MRFNLFQSGPSTATSEGSSTPLAKSAATPYETILQDEEKYQAKQYQTYEEVPGCMQLL